MLMSGLRTKDKPSPKIRGKKGRLVGGGAATCSYPAVDPHCYTRRNSIIICLTPPAAEHSIHTRGVTIPTLDPYPDSEFQHFGKSGSSIPIQ